MNEFKTMWAKAFDFQGRSSVKEFWMSYLFTWGIYFAMAVITVALSSTFIFIMLMVYLVAVLIPSLSVFVRRLHDIDKSGWWILISFLPFGSILLIVYLVTPSTGDNRFGQYSVK